MRKTTNLLGSLLFVAFSCFGISASSAASTDDVKWINQCVEDNKSETANKDVVLKYCVCMNEKMDESETKSITEWEKTHETERKACDRVAGWR